MASVASEYSVGFQLNFGFQLIISHILSGTDEVSAGRACPHIGRGSRRLMGRYRKLSKTSGVASCRYPRPALRRARSGFGGLEHDHVVRRPRLLPIDPDGRFAHDTDLAPGRHGPSSTDGLHPRHALGESRDVHSELGHSSMVRLHGGEVKEVAIDPAVLRATSCVGFLDGHRDIRARTRSIASRKGRSRNAS
jgi:hypothetical protein